MLYIDKLTVTDGFHTIIDDISLHVNTGEILGLVGESGCGKSVTALSILGLLPQPALRIEHGQILFDGQNLSSLAEKQLCGIRGGEIAMIFQEPMTSLNPVFCIGDQITEVLYLHQQLSRSERHRKGREHARRLLARVGFAAAEQALQRFPHQLSGGQRQRVMIAMALACAPKVLIADEPTTALDVTVQAQILELIKSLCFEDGLAVLLITHDLGVVKQYCEQVAVMYCGQIVEQGSCADVFAKPLHRYTKALLNTIPASNVPGARLPAIAGTVPEVGNYPIACRFAPRCDAALTRCTIDPPELEHTAHRVRCWNPVT